MTLIKIYQCDVCGKQLDKYCLYRFKMSEDISLDDVTLKEIETEFDICKRCYKGIVKQIRKEIKAGGTNE